MDTSIVGLWSALILSGGLLFGALTAWFITKSFYKNQITSLTYQSQAEEARLAEKLEDQIAEVGKLKIELVEAEDQMASLRQEIGRVKTEQAQLEERVKLLPKLQQTLENEKSKAEVSSQDLSDLREKYGASESTISAQKKQLDEYLEALIGVKSFRDGLLEEKEGLQTRLATIEAELEAERQQSKDKLALLNDAKEELSNQFKSLANDILEDKSKRFTEQNKENLNQLLNPLKTKIGEFQGKVEEVYIQEGKDRSALAEQVKQMMELNRQISSDTLNLTKALKGQSKAQGNWGEMILERVLEVCGLSKGQEYDVQESIKREDGSRGQPDVVVHLPESRHLVIDAKVSLTAYEAYVNSDDEGGKKAALKRHLDSLRGHIKDLSGKNYQDLYGVESLDFVIMFVPVESAFTLASINDTTLWQLAWEKNVLLVCPSTLLFVIRSVAHLWRQEQQSRNAQEIAKKGADLYDKFVGFVDDLNEVGKRMDQARASYDSACKKLSTGRGNLVKRTELLKKLGVNTKKSLPSEMVDLALEETSLKES